MYESTCHTCGWTANSDYPVSVCPKCGSGVRCQEASSSDWKGSLALILIVAAIFVALAPGGMILMLLSNFIEFSKVWFWISCIVLNLIIFVLCGLDWKKYGILAGTISVIVTILCWCIEDFCPWSFMGSNLFG